MCMYDKIIKLKRGADGQEYPIREIARDFYDNRKKGIAAEAFARRVAIRWE